MATAETKKVTIRDLQTFIDAVEFASDTEEWVPSARQWKRIRQMINDLEESPPPQIQRQQSNQPNFGTPQYAGPPISGSSLAVPAGYQQQTQPAVQLPPVFGTGAQQPAKTPDIDTSNGQYKSNFV